MRLNGNLSLVLMRDFMNIMATYSFDNIIFVSDTRQKIWRKDIYPEYKDGRKKDDTIDWETVYREYDIFKENVRKKLPYVRLFEAAKIEGDDFIAHSVKESNKRGDSNVIVATDVDYDQLLSFNMEERWINIRMTCKMSDNRTFIPYGSEVFYHEVINNTEFDFFEPSKILDFVYFLETLNKKSNIVFVNNYDSLFLKITTGDKGDNIKSVFRCKDKRYNENANGIGGAGAEKILAKFKDIYGEDTNPENDDFVEKLSNVIIFDKKISREFQEEALYILDKNIKFNRSMVSMDKKYVPENIYSIITETYNKEMEREVIYQPESEISEEPVSYIITENSDNIMETIDDFFNM